MKKKVIIILSLIALVACSSNHLLEKYSDSYKIELNGKEVNLKSLYLDKDNIKSVKINKMEEKIRIIQKNINTEYHSLCESDTLDYLINKGALIIVNGMLQEDSCKNVLFENNSIKNILILSDSAMMMFCSPRRTIVIQTNLKSQ
jgi:23S rRNA-/tRNA-specific pseudouridylate synthase